MNFASDPLTLALALGLLGPAAVDDQGLFDEGPRDDSVDAKELAQTLASVLDVDVDETGERAVLNDEDGLEELTVDLLFEE